MYLQMYLKTSKTWRGIKNCVLSRHIKDFKTDINTNHCWQSFQKKHPGSFAVLVFQDKSHQHFCGRFFVQPTLMNKKKNRDEIKINTFSKKYFSCWSEIKSLSQYDNYTCLKPMYSFHNLLKSKILYKSSRHRKVEVLTLFSLLMT